MAGAQKYVHCFSFLVSGCDTVSSFAEENCVEYIRRSHPPYSIRSLRIPALLMISLRYWCFVVLLYDQTSTKTKVNETQKHLFSQKGLALHQLKLEHMPIRQGTDISSCPQSQLLVNGVDTNKQWRLGKEVDSTF